MPRNPNPPTKSLPPWDTWIQQATQEKSKGSMGRESAYKQREQARMNVMAPLNQPSMRKYYDSASKQGLDSTYSDKLAKGMDTAKRKLTDIEFKNDGNSFSSKKWNRYPLAAGMRG